MQTNPDKQASESRGSAHTENEMDEEDPTQGIPDWLQPFTENLEDLETHAPAHPSDREISDSEGGASEKGTQKRKHSIFSHFPKDRNCDMRLRTKKTRAPCRRRNEGSIPRAEKFGDLTPAEHKILNEGRESRNNHRYAVVVQVLATQWNPCQTKNSQETEKYLRKLTETGAEAKSYSYVQFIIIWQVLWTSTPHRSETNGIAERAKRRVKEGTSAVLLQFGLDDEWLSDSMECYCYLRNVQDLLADGKTLHGRRFGESSKGPIIPFGALVEYLQNSERDKARIRQFGKKVLPGIFPGYTLIAGEEFGKEAFWLLILKNIESWMHQKFIPEDRMQKKSY